MRNDTRLFSLVILALLCLAMGGGGDGPVTFVPEPDRNFSARIVDQSDTSYTVDNLSVDGLTLLPAEMGKAEIGVDFSKIDIINFYLQGERELAEVIFSDSRQKKFYLSPETVFYARSQWGNMKLLCKDIKTIDFIK
ncbi:MAG: hypothetical protein ACQES5_00860 [Thermodesulfobacteriota bacterium]